MSGIVVVGIVSTGPVEETEVIVGIVSTRLVEVFV